jgi:cyclohexanone monooxygenase
MIVSIEQHVDWIADCVAHLRERGLATIEATAEAEAAWVAHVREAGARTVYPKARSWYMGANIPGKPRVFLPYIGGFPAYSRTLADITARGYAGFRLHARPQAAA